MRHQKGFTLIELMIVIAILGIILAVVAGAVKDHRGDEVQMSQSGGTLADAPVSTLVCKDSDGVLVSSEPAIPGERWDADGDNYVTADATGKPHIVTTPAGGDCTIETQASL